MKLEDILAYWQAQAERGVDITRAANALLWRWPDDLEIAEAMALRGAGALTTAVEGHLAWLASRHANETEAERQARRQIGVAGVQTARRGTPGPLPDRMAWLSGRFLFDSEALGDRVRALQPGRSTAEAAILAVAEVLTAWWQSEDYAEQQAMEREALAAMDEAHDRRWGASAVRRTA